LIAIWALPHFRCKLAVTQAGSAEPLVRRPREHAGVAGRTRRGRTFNHDRPHSSLGGSTPAERIAELAPKIPTREAVHATYDPSREFIRPQNTRYRWLPTNPRVT
jgi:hypothetical protein